MSTSIARLPPGTNENTTLILAVYARGNFSGIGDPHGNDILDVYAPSDITEYFVRFVNTLDPNTKHGGVRWPVYNPTDRAALTFSDNTSQPIRVTKDVERLLGMLEVANLSLEFPS